MKIYKVWDFHIPSEVFDIGDKDTGYSIKVTNSYVVFESKDKRELSLNATSTKAAFQIDGIIFSSIIKSVGDYYVTYFKRIGMDAPWVVHNNRFDKDKILADFLGLEISDDDDRTILFDLKTEDNKVTLTFSLPVSVTIEIDSEGKAYINGNESSDPVEYTYDTFKVKAVNSNLDAYTKASSKKELVTLTDINSSEYYVEYKIKDKIFTKKPIEIGEYIFSRYGDVLKNIKNTNFYANIYSFYLKDEDRYVGRDEYSLVGGKDNVVHSAPKSRISSAFIEYEDSKAMYDYGLFKSTDRLIPMYAYVSSSYAYVKWYRAKASLNACDITDDGSLEEVYKLYVRKGRYVQVKKDNTGKTVLLDDSGEFATKYLNALKHGFGVFSNELFTLKKYQDDGSTTKIIFNYKNSKTYYEVDIYDETTRYKIVETRKVDGDSRQSTYYYYSYRKEPEKELGNTESMLNMYKKEMIDYAQDLKVLKVHIGAKEVEPFTVIDYSDALFVNTTNTKIKFPSSSNEMDIFGKTVLVIDDSLKFYNIVYQSISDTIYVLDEDGQKMSISDFVNMFNEYSAHYKMNQACAYSKFKYKDLNNEDRELEFPLSTLFLTELVNTPAGIVNRVYYKNSYDIGFIEAIEYEIEDL